MIEKKKAQRGGDPSERDPFEAQWRRRKRTGIR
jgi:hypothetical protein